MKRRPPIVIPKTQSDPALYVKLNLLYVILCDSYTHLSSELLRINPGYISHPILPFKLPYYLMIFGPYRVVKRGLPPQVMLYLSVMKLKEFYGLGLILSHSQMQSRPLIIV